MEKTKGAKRFSEFLLNYALYIILGTILITVSVIKPNFIAFDNVLNILKQASTKGILALGCAGLIVLAGTDLSIGRVLGLSAAVTASLVQATSYASRYYPGLTTDLPLIVPFLASIIIAVIFSLLNGFGVAKLHMHAFIITLGTQLIAYGANCLYIEAQPAGTAQALSTFNKNFLNTAAGNLMFGNHGGNIYLYTSSNRFLIRIPVFIMVLLGLSVAMLIVFNVARGIKRRLGGKIKFVNYAILALMLISLLIAVIPSFNTEKVINTERADILAQARDIDAPIETKINEMEPALTSMNAEIIAMRGERNTLVTENTEAQTSIETAGSYIAILKGEKEPSAKQKSTLGDALKDDAAKEAKLAQYEQNVASLTDTIAKNDVEIAALDARLEEANIPYNALNAEYRVLVSEHTTMTNVINNLNIEGTEPIAGFTGALASMTNFHAFGTSILKIPLVVLYFLLLALIMWVVWNKTRLGKSMFAVGGNMEAAAVSGVNVAKTIMLVYLIAGVLYGIASFLEAARVQSVGANTGINYECDAISACVIGGVSFSGGVGTIQGVVIGAIILQAINFSLNFIGVNPYFQYIIRGLIIVLAVAIDVRKYLVKK